MSEMVRLLEADPDLGRELSPEAFEEAAAGLGARTVEVSRGRWDFPAAWTETNAELGLLNVEGVLLSEVAVGVRMSLEVLGPGDLLRPWPARRFPPQIEVIGRVTAPQDARLAVLDTHVIAQAMRWPSILGQVVDRSMGRTSSATLRLLIQQVVRIDERLLLA